jgi:alkylation response protein AidB-like acyl-CoA dehydrogenase
MSSGCLPAYVAKDIFAQDDHACMAASVTPALPAEDRPPHRATVVDGGYRVSGRWAFTSGCMHATWLIGNAPIYEDESPRMGPNGPPETRLIYFPRQACQIIDTWGVTGLRGTGSHDFAVVDVFVPHERTAPQLHHQPHHPGALTFLAPVKHPRPSTIAPVGRRCKCGDGGGVSGHCPWGN